MAHFSVTRFPSFSQISRLAGQRFPKLFSRFALAIALSAVLSQSAAHAQGPPSISPDDQMGFMPYVSYHGGNIDNVNVVTGNLVVNLPFLSYPQRGDLKAQFDLMYNGHPLQVQYVCLPNVKCQLLWVQAGFVYPWAGLAPSPSIGVNVVDSDHVTLGQSSTKITVCGTCDPLLYAYQTLFKLMTADNASHLLGLLPSTGGNCGNTSESESPYYWYSDWGTFQTLDATGWQVVIPEPSQTQCGLDTPPATFVSPEGVRHLNGDTVREDPNGNQITISAGTMTDTMGRSIPMPPTSQSSSNASTSLCPAGALPATLAVYWTPPGYNGVSQKYLFCYANVPVNISTLAENTANAVSGTITMLQSITLPNSTWWLFAYNDTDGTSYNGKPTNYGSLTQITLPTGGTISYTYVTGGSPTDRASRWVASRTVNANDGTGAHTWTYSYGSPGTVTDPLGNVTVHTFGTASGACTSSCWPYEVLTQYYQGSQTSGTLLKTVATTYQFAGSGSNMPNVAIPEVPLSTTVTWPNSQVTETVKAYDSGFTYVGDYDQGAAGYTGIYGKVVAQTDYDYGSGAKGSPLRTTNTSYAWQSPNPNYSSYLSNNLLDLPYSVQVVNGSGTQMAYTYYGYDGSGLQSSGVTEQHVAGESYPGNQTSVHRWLNGSTVAQGSCTGTVSNGYLVSSKVYFDTGEVDTSTDPCGYPTTYQYSSTYYGALLTTVTNALGQSTIYGYDFDTGAVTSIEDPNLQTTTEQYDILTRPTEVNYPDGGETGYCYTDMGGSGFSTCTKAGPPYEVVRTRAISSSPLLNEISKTVFDGLGRLSQTQLSDPSGVDYTLTTYDAVGRKSQVYNPTRCSPITTNCGETTWGYTTYVYDALSRVCVVGQPDGTAVSQSAGCPTSAPAGDVFTQNTPPCATVTDEAGKIRTSCVDGLGRLTSLCEVASSPQFGPAAAACGQPTPMTGFLTTYGYDALSNLLTVNQGSLGPRTFAYDSLSDLLCAANPETGNATCPTPDNGSYTAGTTRYGYDADGNMALRTRPAPNQTRGSTTVATTYAYDALNRLTQKSYSDGVTLPALFGYDQTNITMGSQQFTIAHSVGRLSWTCVESSSTCLTMSALSYDPMGRTAEVWRSNPVNNNNIWVSYGYDFLGDEINRDLNGDTYAATYNAIGQLTSFTATDYTDSTNPANLLTGAGYDPSGHLTAATFANGLSQSWAYDNRGRPKAAAVGTTCSGGTCMGSTKYGYSVSYAGDGDIVSATDTVNGQWAYTYDGFNRLLTSCSSNCPVGGSTPGFSYGYDRYGNRWTQTLTAGSGSWPQPSFTFTGAQNGGVPNNRIDSDSYDAAGNLLNDGPNSYTYDAENRIKSVNSGATTYTYDAEGRRVAKTTGGSLTDFIYDRQGQVILILPSNPTLIEMNVAGLHLGTYVLNPGQTDGTFYYDHSDWLGTERARTNLSGTACETIQSLPFGDGQVINSTCGDVSQRHFNGKERDSESGLDEFGARYYASSMGRFMTSDPIGIMKQKFADPQQWNMYAYARNNPLSAIDVSGQFVYSIHDALTTTTLAAAGYSSSVAKAISWENQKTDLYFNDEAHAYMHSQARRVSQNGRLHLQTAAEARAEEHKFIETSLGDAASEVWAGDFAAARKNFGGALHAAQDEKHEWTPFQLHTGNPFNDQLTSVGRFQEDTDFNPTAQQLQDARRRSAEVVQQFEDAVRVNGALNQKTNEETEERLYEFRNGLDPH
jgi:RHS repeat-associated protein